MYMAVPVECRRNSRRIWGAPLGGGRDICELHAVAFLVPRECCSSLAALSRVQHVGRWSRVSPSLSFRIVIAHDPAPRRSQKNSARPLLKPHGFQNRLPLPTALLHQTGRGHRRTMGCMQLNASSFMAQYGLRSAITTQRPSRQPRAGLQCRATLASPPAGWGAAASAACMCVPPAATPPPRRRCNAAVAAPPCCLPAAPKLFQYDGPLDEVDPEIASIIRSEKQRQVCRRVPAAPPVAAQPWSCACPAMPVMVYA